MALMTPSSALKRSVSTRTWSVSILSIFIVTLVTTPVSPMPPAVAQKSSASFVGDTVNAPLGVTRRISVTWVQNDPSTWWFFPCTSAATAPPIETWRVPGVTGTNQPWGIDVASSWSIDTPAPTVTIPSSPMGPTSPSSRLSSTMPPLNCAASP